MRCIALIVVIIVAALSAACGRTPPGTLTNAQAVELYGYSPQPNPRVAYQPDVILIGGGPRAIRGMASGRRWIIDATAPGARQLAPGKVMLATSRAVGRVIDVEPRGGDLIVRLAPVRFTDVVRDAQIDFDQEIPYEALRVHKLDELQPPVAQNLDSGPVAGPSPAIWYPQAQSGRLIPVDVVDPRDNSATEKSTQKVSIGDWELEPYLKKSIKTKSPPDKNASPSVEDRTTSLQLGVKVQRRAGGGLKLGADFGIYASKLRIRTHTSVVGGKVTKSDFLIEGLNGFKIGFAGGIANGTSDNVKVRLEVPVEFTEDIPIELTGGVPMAMQQKMKLLVETAFSGRNSTLSGDGEYELTGPIGVENGTVHTPTLSLKRSLLQSIDGVAVGPSGVVVAIEFRFLLGFGEASAMAGPYAKVVAAAGVSRGSALGMADCRSVTLKLDGGVGVGAVIDSRVSDFVNKLLGGTRVKTEAEIAETLFNVINRTTSLPDIPMCRIS